MVEKVPNSFVSLCLNQIQAQNRKVIIVIAAKNLLLLHNRDDSLPVDFQVPPVSFHPSNPMSSVSSTHPRIPIIPSQRKLKRLSLLTSLRVSSHPLKSVLTSFVLKRRGLFLRDGLGQN
jgi:hypothetical protein